MNTLSKGEARALAKEARAALSPAERAAGSEQIVRRLLNLPELLRAQTLLSYAPLPGEVDLTALHEALTAAGKKLCFPVTGDGGQMTAVLPAAGAAWQTGRYGIREPVGEPVPPEALELILAPCLAFDDRGTRLGWGGGYYDRYLSLGGRAIAVAVAFECQHLRRLPRETGDRPVKLAVTERRIYRF